MYKRKQNLNNSTINIDTHKTGLVEFNITKKRESAGVLNWKYGNDIEKTSFFYKHNKEKEFMKKIGPGSYNLASNVTVFPTYKHKNQSSQFVSNT